MPIDLTTLRRAIHEKIKLQIDYSDAGGRKTRRTIWPLVLIYYVDAVMIAVWCALRADLRHYRLDRVAGHCFLRRISKHRARH